MSKALKAKIEKVLALVSEYNAQLGKEKELDTEILEGVVTRRTAKDRMEDISYNFKKIDEKIAKVWESLSEAQQHELLKAVPENDRWILDGI